MASDFSFLMKYRPYLAQTGQASLACLHTDAAACIRQLNLLGDGILQEICDLEKPELPEQASRADKIRALRFADVLPTDIDNMLYLLHRSEIKVNENDPAIFDQTQELLQTAFDLCCRFIAVYVDETFTAPAFQMPEKGHQTDETGNAPVTTTAQTTVEQPTPDIPDGALQIKADVLPVLNFAMQQNGILPVTAITIENDTDIALQDIDLVISSTPSFTEPFSRRINHLPADKTVTLTQPECFLDGAFLAGMTERINGVLHIELKSGEKTLARERAYATVSAFDEWQGINLYPELLASFVTPNNSEVSPILARATQHLGEWTGDTSVDGYQSQDPNRVRNQAAAIFTAIKELAIAYVVPPAGFEHDAQRVRMCDTVVQQKMGSCLDLTLFYASCLEAAGLNPLLVLTEGHIFTGLWLEDKMFPECIQDDYSVLTKRMASGVNEIAVIETTAVTTTHDLSFDSACDIAKQTLNEKQIECIIDVKRARAGRIFPLPQRIGTENGWTVVNDASFSEETMQAPTRLDDSVYADTDANGENLPKKMQWERKLLDLGMRNTLINLRMTKNLLPLLTNSTDLLLRALTDDSEFTVLPRPEDLKPETLSFDTLCQAGTDNIITAEFENKRLRSVLPENELSTTVKGLYRTAKAALEENGANTLYLALGMLRWYETKRSKKARYAPIILVPVELVRKSAAKGYVIRLRDEEPQMNITLLEKLKQDFGIIVKGTDPLPTNEQGIDIRKVLTILRKAVMEQAGWDVLETACVGIFSFSQFVMWNDIRNRTEDLMRNKVVRSLIEGRLCWNAEPLEIGDKVNEDGVLIPMPADATQLYAIQVACNGESFVLHGPPGTGKSQTITSLIVNALAQGKRVLFVAEKMAALEVVQKRLDSIGIGPFCLELHSNKSKKKDVLEQLRKASEVTAKHTAEDYAVKAEQLACLRAELNDYAQALHRLLPCGSTLYALINEYESCPDVATVSPFERSFLRGLTQQALHEHQLVIERMIAVGKEIGHPDRHPLQRVTCTQYSQTLRNTLPAVVSDYIGAIEHISRFVTHFTNTLGLPLPASYEDVYRLYKTAAYMVCWYELPAAWTKTDFPQLYFEEVIALARHCVRLNELESAILTVFNENALTLDTEALFNEYVEQNAKWALAKKLGINKIAKKLSAYAKAAVPADSIQEHLTTLREYQQERKITEELFAKYGQDLGALYCGKATDWNAVAARAATAAESAQVLYGMYGSHDLLHAWCGNAQIRNTVFGLWQNFDSFAQAKSGFDNLLGIVPMNENDWLQAQLTLCTTVLGNADKLKDWIAYVACSAQARASGLGNIVDHYENGTDHTDVLFTYRKTLLQGLIADAIDSSLPLNQFSGIVFNKKIEQFKRMEQEWRSISQQEAFCRLAAKVPNFTREAAQNSELGILQRCIKSGARGISLRKLFDQIPNLLPRLCPCMLMSPISAAQYLDPKRELFDIVVFDEASQLPTCKAVGVLARGKDAVIVGDPKQMPPTSFFATVAEDEEHPETEDLESILDDCLALNMPQAHLLWHYRSRHESLIAFSNSNFYENKLFTFPSVNDRESKVSLVHVEGVFDRGKTRTNKAEAQAIVDELIRRYNDPVLSKQSIGIVTFNIAQQHLIDDLFTEACANDEALDKWADNEEEPLFIKNLENVQGDERDVILFSVGFGPDAKGKVTMNFGPLNRDGGWRRLNVAVSRARCEMMVFSTLRPEQIDLNRTRAQGVVALRNFLSYAEGRMPLTEETVNRTQQHTQEGIATAICKALEEKGYQTVLAVGRSEYRVDIGVTDPTDPERYILGIMLDGPAYAAAKTTRDREIAQIGVLNGLGWNILRVWCMDWWDNSEKELNRILTHLRDLLAQAQAAAETDTDPENEDADAAQDEADTDETDTADTQDTSEEKAAPTAPESVSEDTVPQEIPLCNKNAPVYTAAKLPVKAMTADEFMLKRNLRWIRTKITSIIEKEAPVSLPLLTKRLLQCCQISRAGTRMQTYIHEILQQTDLLTTVQDGVVFCWKRDLPPQDYVGFRVCGEDENRREIRDVAAEEIVNALCVVLYEQISMGTEDLAHETAEKLGYTRVSNPIQTAMQAGIAAAIEQGLIAEGANRTFILTDLGNARAEATLQSF